MSVLAGAPSADAPMTFLRSFGAKADQVLPLTWGLTVISILVVVIVSALLLRSLFASPAIGGLPNQKLPVERPTGGLAWIYVGTAISAMVLFGSAVWTMVTLAAVGQPAGKPAFTVEVTGHQWWWQVRYLSGRPARIFTTANEIHIPVGEPVEVRLTTADVIHSFWVPALTGKTDLIPGQTNLTWIEADKPGVYRGQCTEFCGEQHAHMGLTVVANKPQDFDAWWDAQLKAPAPAVAESAEQGEAVFVGRCGICHSVRGSSAGGKAGPDLSHLMTRRTIAAGTLPNTPGNLAGWIADPQHIKPGSHMPRTEVTPEQLQQIVAYLQTLN
ncbi:MAG TPA: cytochrome c oxidase subunit II [Methyloceanibacter sp.]|jgi:cytochrome c oxidase subunit II|nr:cytochrome c oxidase subunit II [Methyloceanibacter sp.]